MTDLLRLILAILASPFKSRAELEAENLILRQQINVLCRRMPKRPALTNIDRLLFVWVYRWFPSTAGAIAIVRPETIIRWHRIGFRAYWRWRSRNRVGRPKAPAELRALIGEMSRANPLWGAHPRRTAQAGLRCRPVDSCQVHGATAGATVPRLEHLSPQSRASHHRH